MIRSSERVPRGARKPQRCETLFAMSTVNATTNATRGGPDCPHGPREEDILHERSTTPRPPLEQTVDVFVGSPFRQPKFRLDR